METAIMMGVAGFILFAVIAIGGAVYHTVKNRRLARQSVYAEYDRAMQQADEESAPQDLFFIREEKSGKTVRFYASAPSIGVEIPSSDPVDCDYEEICAFVDRIYDNTEDNFFVLEDDKGNCIQFCHSGMDESIELDIPVADEKGSYKGEFTNLKDVKTCIRSFYSGVNIAFDYPVKFETW